MAGLKLMVFPPGFCKCWLMQPFATMITFLLNSIHQIQGL